MVEQIVIPKGEDWIAKVRETALERMKQNHSCAQSILSTFMDEFGIDDPLVIRAAGAMHTGMLCSLTCGVYTGALMTLGLLMGREKLEAGVDGLFPIMLPGQELVSRLRARLGAHSCRDLVYIDFTDIEQIGEYYASDKPESCLTFVADGAEELGMFLQEKAENGELFRPDI